MTKINSMTKSPSDARPSRARSCIICGSEFTPHRPAHVACSPPCSRQRKRDTAAAHHARTYVPRPATEIAAAPRKPRGRPRAKDERATLREQCIIGTKRYLQALIAAGYLTAEIAA